MVNPYFREVTDDGGESWRRLETRFSRRLRIMTVLDGLPRSFKSEVMVVTTEIPRGWLYDVTYRA